MIALGVWTDRGTGMNSLRVALCGAAFALLAAASPAQATTTVVSGNYTGSLYTSAAGGFSLGPGSYRVNLAFSGPVSNLSGFIEDTVSSDDYCDFGGGEEYCDGSYKGLDFEFSMISPELNQVIVTVNGPRSIVFPPGDFLVREDQTDSSCGFSIGFTSGGPGQFTLSYVAVPEPATWLMMLIGFGAIGAAARRRQMRNLHETSCTRLSAAGRGSAQA